VNYTCSLKLAKEERTGRPRLFPVASGESDLCATMFLPMYLLVCIRPGFRVSFGTYTNWRLAQARIHAGPVAEEDAEALGMLLTPQKSITALWAAVGASASDHTTFCTFAVRHLSAPPASSATERLFSQVKNVYTDKRRRMKPGTP